MTNQNEGIRLLLVDDEVEFLDSVERALSRRGFQVFKAQNANVALILLEKHPFDVAVLDVKMPVIQGDELFRIINRRWPKIPVLILTGHGTVEQAFHTSRDGVIDYLTKPITMEKLARAARQAAAESLHSMDARPAGESAIPVRLLAVDAEKEWLDALTRTLSRRGMDVSTVTKGIQALNQIDRRHFDVILLDVMLPGVSGAALFERIRSSDPTTSIIVLTGRPSQEEAIRMVRAGAFDYVNKPCDVATLTETIHKASRASRRRMTEARDRQIGMLIEDRPD